MIVTYTLKDLFVELMLLHIKIIVKESFVMMSELLITILANVTVELKNKILFVLKMEILTIILVLLNVLNKKLFMKVSVSTNVIVVMNIM